MTDFTIDPESLIGGQVLSTFRELSDHQRRQQDAIGFGEEGDDLRADLENLDRVQQQFPGSDLTEERARSESALRNYYIAKIALITNEVSEAIEEIRNNHAIDETYYPEKGSPDSPFEKSDAFGPFKPEGVPSELADVVIRVFSLCGEAGIDLGGIVLEKMNYNAGRSHKHGGKSI